MANKTKMRMMTPSAFPRDHNSGPVSLRTGPECGAPGLEFDAPGPLEEFGAPGLLREFEAPGPLEIFESLGTVFTVLVDDDTGDDDTREGTGLSCMVELIRLTSSSSVSFYKGNCPRTQLRSLEKITLASGATLTDRSATSCSLR